MNTMVSEKQTEASKSPEEGPAFWKKLRGNVVPLGICLALLLFSITQAFYFRADLRKLMLETGRRTRYAVSPDKKDWLYGAKYLFDGDTQSPAKIPLMEKGKAEVDIELALTHFPSALGGSLPILRRPILLEIYNGACAQCPRSLFQKYNRIREARIEIALRKLKLPIFDYFLPEEVSIWKKKIRFPNKPGLQKIDLSSVFFYRISKKNKPREVGVVLLKIYVDSIYHGSLEPQKLFLAEVRYADQDILGKKKLHYWH